MNPYIELLHHKMTFKGLHPLLIDEECMKPLKLPDVELLTPKIVLLIEELISEILEIIHIHILHCITSVFLYLVNI